MELEPTVSRYVALDWRTRIGLIIRRKPGFHFVHTAHLKGELEPTRAYNEFGGHLEGNLEDPDNLSVRGRIFYAIKVCDRLRQRWEEASQREPGRREFRPDIRRKHHHKERNKARRQL